MRDGNEQFCHMWISFSAISEGIYCRGTVSSCRMLSGLDSISANICKQYNNPSTIRNMSKHTFYWRVHLSTTIWLDPFFFLFRKPLSLFFLQFGFWCNKVPPLWPLSPNQEMAKIAEQQLTTISHYPHHPKKILYIRHLG